MKEFSIGNAVYRLDTHQRDGRWFARAERSDTSDRFGPECGGESERVAVDRLVRWIQWQHEHTAALEALQRAEHAYHRTIAGSAFASATEGPSAIEIQKESLEQVEAARVRLDEVRARRPE
jgi:hypothetical protein